jgi:hypothetical protein
MEKKRKETRGKWTINQTGTPWRPVSLFFFFFFSLFLFSFSFEIQLNVHRHHHHQTSKTKKTPHTTFSNFFVFFQNSRVLYSLPERPTDDVSMTTHDTTDTTQRAHPRHTHKDEQGKK